MKIYNSLSQKLEEFKPIKPKQVSIYICGPTVYNYPHVGNVRPMVVFDTLKRVFEASDYHVRLVSNYTDVDDKIINAAKDKNIDEKEISEKFIAAYNEDRKSLNVQIPDSTPKVTETMDEIISFIEKLVEQGYAYEVEGDVYFRVNKIEEYGKLSNQKIDDLLVGARIDENTNKENALDFTLWKKTNSGLMWESKFSHGRPGWHSECVVMIDHEFNHELIDIHGGGMDLKFPHHENEIAQSKAIHKHSIANYWMHNGMVNMDGEKMSKSLGNVIWAKDLINKIGGNTLRWIMLSVHYRAPLNISSEVIDMSLKELDKIATVIKQASVKVALSDKKIEVNIDQQVFNDFLEPLCDDLNTPNAFAIIFKIVKELNQVMRANACDILYVNTSLLTLKKCLDTLGITYINLILSESDKETYHNWKSATLNKAYEKADIYRQELIEKGIL